MDQLRAVLCRDLVERLAGNVSDGLALLNRHNLLPDIARAFGAPVQEIIRLSHEMAVTVHRNNEGRN